MAWSYTGDPAAVARDAVRLLCGQTSSGDAVLLADEEVTWAISQTGNSYYAAALCAEALAARYRQTQPQTESIGQLSVGWGDRATALTQLAKSLRTRAAIDAVTPFLGGQSVADQEERDGDGDLRQPAFRVEQFDETTQGSTE